MNTSITLSNSPSPVKRTDNSQRAFELAGELYGTLQQWNLLINTGRNILKAIIKNKLLCWENPEHVVYESDLEAQCDLLGSLLYEMEALVKQIERIKDQYAAIEKLMALESQKMTANLSDTPQLLFLTWPTSKFVAVVSSIHNAYMEEFQLKKSIAENIAHCEKKQLLDFYNISWIHQVYVSHAVKLQLESLLVETGQR